MATATPAVDHERHSDISPCHRKELLASPLRQHLPWTNQPVAKKTVTPIAALAVKMVMDWNRRRLFFQSAALSYFHSS
jgi:hypothetical protein